MLSIVLIPAAPLKRVPRKAITMNDMLPTITPLVPALRRFARALLRDRSAADDLVRDCLEIAVIRWSRRENSTPRVWMFTILNSLTTMRLRLLADPASQAATASARDRATTPALPSSPNAPDNLEVLTALDRLPPEEKTVLLLVTIENFTYAETATITGVALNTVVSRLARGREQLSKEMAREEGSGSAPHLRSVK
jgi:RNA polymerase sigma factor (sigma-70 family)